MPLRLVTIGENLEQANGRISLARKKTRPKLYDSRFSSSNKYMSAGHYLQLFHSSDMT